MYVLRGVKELEPVGALMYLKPSIRWINICSFKLFCCFLKKTLVRKQVSTDCSYNIIHISFFKKRHYKENF